MAAAILSQSSVSKSIVGQLVLEDLVVDVAPDMEFADSSTFKPIFKILAASLDAVAATCCDMRNLPTVISAERRRVAAGGQVCVDAFDLFVKRIED